MHVDPDPQLIEHTVKVIAQMFPGGTKSHEKAQDKCRLKHVFFFHGPVFHIPQIVTGVTING